MSIDFKVGDKVVDVTYGKVYHYIGVSYAQKDCYIFERVKDSKLVGHTESYVNENIVKVSGLVAFTLPHPLTAPKEGMFYLYIRNDEWAISKSTYKAGRSLDIAEEIFAFKNFLCFENEKYAKMWLNFLKGNYYG